MGIKVFQWVSALGNLKYFNGYLQFLIGVKKLENIFFFWRAFSSNVYDMLSPKNKYYFGKIKYQRERFE